MTISFHIRPALVLLSVSLLALLAGCGSDSSGESSTQTQASPAIPTVTSPLATSTAAAPTTTGGKKGEAVTTNAGGSGSCSIPDAYTDFKFAGLDCSAAVAVATAWDQNGKTCNTVDNPESPIGPQRTCSVEGFTCVAKRDIHSDARFVTCTQGGQSVRFTWLPA